jgi:hypothetical protein
MHIAIVSTHLFPLHEGKLAQILVLFAVPNVGLTNCQPRSGEVLKCICQQSRDWRISFDCDALTGKFHEATPSRTCSRQPPETMALRRMDPEGRIRSLEFVRLFVGNMLSDMRHAGDRRRHCWRAERGILVFPLTRVRTTYHAVATRSIMARRPKSLSHPAIKTPPASVAGNAYILHDLTQTTLGLRRVRHTGMAVLETSFDDAR